MGKSVNKESIREEAEQLIDRGDKPSFDEIRSLMKKSGKSYIQIMRETKALKKSMDQARENTENEGKYFDEHAYLKGIMNQATKK